MTTRPFVLEFGMGVDLQDIRQSENVAWTMVNGRLYDAATMNETGSRERKRAKYWWE